MLCKVVERVLRYSSWLNRTQYINLGHGIARMVYVHSDLYFMHETRSELLRFRDYGVSSYKINKVLKKITCYSILSTFVVSCLMMFDLHFGSIWIKNKWNLKVDKIWIKMYFNFVRSTCTGLAVKIILMSFSNMLFYCL